MTSENKFILYGSYEKAFTAKSIEAHFIAPFEIFQEIPDYKNSEAFNYEYFYKKNRHKTAVMQMFLLADKITLVDPSIEYDYSKLINSGFVEVFTAENNDELLGNFDMTDDIITTLSLFKPIIIKNVTEFFKKIEIAKYIKDFGCTPKKFTELLFEHHYSPVYKNVKNDKFEIVKKILTKYHKESFERTGELYKDMGVDKETAHHIYATSLVFSFNQALGTISKLNEISKKTSSKVLQDQYSFDILTKSKNRLESIVPGNDYLNSYQLLKVSLENQIGQLPKLDTLDDVIKLKEKKRKDIFRLNEIIANIEDSLREGRAKAILKANAEIGQAVKELNKNLTTEKISVWSTYLSIPLSAVELLIGVPSVASICSGITGAIATYKSNRIKKNNEWIYVVR